MYLNLEPKTGHGNVVSHIGTCGCAMVLLEATKLGVVEAKEMGEVQAFGCFRDGLCG